MSYSLLAYPRTGTNYFKKAWDAKTNSDIAVYRMSKELESIPDGETLISTIREPFGSIVSRTMIFFHEPHYEDVKNTIPYCIMEYERIYKAIIKRSSHIVDISALHHIDYVIDDILGVETNKVDPDRINSELDNTERYSRTFTMHEEYEQVKFWVSNFRLATCEELYNQAYNLSKYKNLAV